MTGTWQSYSHWGMFEMPWDSIVPTWPETFGGPMRYFYDYDAKYLHGRNQ